MINLHSYDFGYIYYYCHILNSRVLYKTGQDFLDIIVLGLIIIIYGYVFHPLFYDLIQHGCWKKAKSDFFYKYISYLSQGTILRN